MGGVTGTRRAAIFDYDVNDFYAMSTHGFTVLFDETLNTPALWQWFDLNEDSE